ncbi:unnamed protein product [Prorocentrum cordatum]|uniref:Uncharacterized protein n=1 Tax=Prorocentrum cordatum TaxID=2364126 RepID=A0ABN9RZL7_9DINO|nr:unnamed protein product [Polarella glacialis]
MQETRFIRTALAVGLAASVMEVLPKETRQGLAVGAELPEGILTLGFFMCKTLTMVAIMFNQNLIGTRLLESPVTPVVVLEYHRHETYKNFSRLWMSLWLRDIIIFGTRSGLPSLRTSRR